MKSSLNSTSQMSMYVLGSICIHQSVICQYNSNVLTLVAATLMLQVIPLVESVDLGSRAFAQHVCLWRHEDGWLHALLYAAMNSELKLAMWLCKLYRTIFNFPLDQRCNE